MDISASEADHRVRQARALYQRTLSQWACDVLRLQSQGHRTPTWTPNRSTACPQVQIEIPRRKAA